PPEQRFRTRRRARLCSRFHRGRRQSQRLSLKFRPHSTTRLPCVPRLINRANVFRKRLVAETLHKIEECDAGFVRSLDRFRVSGELFDDSPERSERVLELL